MPQRDRTNQRLWVSLLTSCALASLTAPATAQVIPDATLGTGNNSVTSIRGNRTDITGGLRRSSALFHSFEQFSILTNHQVYFANPAGIRNIFSRVTGSNISNIDGLLGVAGSANLFFMNPNGIIFGPNARLDISGSFLATTANALEFADNQKFAATGDRAVPLVAVNIPIGLQFGANPPAMLVNRGNLATGQNLTLAAGNLDLQGQVQAGGNLTLNATDTVKIRDTVTEPFVARSGGDLTVQGNQGIDILALNHPSTTPFISSGNLSLVSDGIISGDAHYASSGTFQIKSISGQPANFVSLYDPVISSAGDIDIAGNYNGPALLVESLGNIRFLGSVNITGNDPTFTGNANSDLGILGSSAALIVRANRNALAFTPPTTTIVPPDATSNGATFQAGTVPSGITVAGSITTAAGQVILEAVGPIGIGGTTPILANSIVARSITIDTPSDVQIAGGLNARQTTPGAAGDIKIGTINQPRSVTLGIISSRNSSTGNGGNITINTTGAFTTTGAFNLDGTGYVNPGATNPANIVSIASQAEAGRSGNIAINAGGAITLASGVSSASNINDKGGNIFLQGTSIGTTRGVITASNNGVVLGSSPGFVANPGSGGDVTLTATTGDILAGSINATSQTDNAGFSTIRLTSTAGSVILDQANLSTTNTGAAVAGDVFIDADRDVRIINTSGNPANDSQIQSNGLFGRILIGENSSIDQVTISNSSLSTVAGNIMGNSTIPSRISVTADAINVARASITTRSDSPDADAGSIDLAARLGTAAIDNSTISSTANGTNRAAGNISVTSQAASGQAIALTNTSIDAAAFGTGGRTGSVTISAPNRGDVSLIGNRSIFIDTFGSQPTGNLTIFGGNILIDQYRLNANVNTSGIIGGNVLIDGTAVTIQNGGTISTETANGISGNITVRSTSGDLTFAGGALKTTVNAGATGNGGDIMIASNGGQINFSNGFQVNAATNTQNPLAASGRGGDISITSSGGQITVSDGTAIDASTTGTQAGGKVEILSGSGALSVLNSTVNASTSGTSTGGSVSLLSDGSDLTLSGGGVSTASSGQAGNGGDIAIASNGGQITINNGFKVNSATSSQSSSGGRGGNVQISSQGTTNGGQITVDDNAAIDASTSGTQTGGNVSVLSGNQKIQLNSGSISTTVKTGASANGGSIQIQSNGNDITVGTNGAFAINAATEVNSNGQGGNVDISTGGGQISVFNDSAINASTKGFKPGGTISLASGGGDINLSSGTVATTVGSQSAGNGGNITIASNGGAIAFGNTASNTGFQVNAQTQATNTLGSSQENGKGGNVAIASDTGNISLVANSTITAGTTGTKNSGTVTFTGKNIGLADSTISTSSSGSGLAGDISVTGRDIDLIGGKIQASSTSAGSSGNVSVNGADIDLVNSTISTSSSGSGLAGDISVTGRDIDLTGGKIQASSTGAGNSGDVTVTGTDIRLTEGVERSVISTSATGAGASAGNVTLNAPGRTLTLQNSDVLASSQQGASGNITITARRADLKNGTIKAEIGQNTAGKTGSIKLDLSFRLTLEDESEISTLGQNGANGGDISILNVRFLFGKSPTGPNGSDIVGRAEGGGQGGRVFLGRSTLVQGFRFGKAVPGNRTNDIDTNGQLSNFSTDADVGARGLSTPVIVFNDVSQIVRGACEAAGAKSETHSELKITGQGGVPLSPTAPLPAQGTGSDWVSLELSPQVRMGLKAPDGSMAILEPGKIYEIQATCVNAWKQQQRSLL